MANLQQKYIDLGDVSPSGRSIRGLHGGRMGGQVRVAAMGIREAMPKGMISHGGPGSGFPFLLMLFHDIAFVDFGEGRRSSAEGCAVLWRRETPHLYGNPEAEWTHSWLHMEGDWVAGTIDRSGLPLDQDFPLAEGHFAGRYLQLLHDELQRRRAQDPALVEGILALLLAELAKSSAIAKEGADPWGAHNPGLEAARRFIETRCAEPFGLDDAAEVARLSRSHFSVSFSRRYGVPPREYAIRLRLHRAADLLGNLDLSVSEVSRMVGYEDALYFSRLFAKRYGKSPRLYREDMKDSTRSTRQQW